MWELLFYFQDNSTESLKYVKPEFAGSKIRATLKSGLLEVKKNGIIMYYPVKEIKKIQLKQV